MTTLNRGPEDSPTQRLLLPGIPHSVRHKEHLYSLLSRCSLLKTLTRRGRLATLVGDLLKNSVDVTASGHLLLQETEKSGGEGRGE